MHTKCGCSYMACSSRPKDPDIAIASASAEDYVTLRGNVKMYVVLSQYGIWLRDCDVLKCKKVAAVLRVILSQLHTDANRHASWDG